MWAGVGLSVLSHVARNHLRDYGLWVVFLGIGILIRVLESKAWLYQLWPIYGCATIMAGIGWDFGITALVESAQLSQRWKKPAIAFITGMIILWPIYYGYGGRLLRGFRDLIPNLRQSLASSSSYHSLIADSIDQAQIAQYLSEHTDPTDLIQLWGAQPGILYATGRFAPSRFIATHPFLCEGYEKFTMCERNELPVQQAWKAEFLESIRTKHPRYIVAHYANGSLAVEDFTSFAPDFPELREILDQEYELEVTFGIWSVFRRKGTTGPNSETSKSTISLSVLSLIHETADIELVHTDYMW